MITSRRYDGTVPPWGYTRGRGVGIGGLPYIGARPILP